VKLGRFAILVCRANAFRRRVVREHALRSYTDMSIVKLSQQEEDKIKMLRGQHSLDVELIG
jgi:hypothetical protein